MSGPGVESGPDGQLRQLTVVVEPEEGVDPDELDRMVRRLRAELMDVEVEDVEPVAAEDAPAGAKAGDPVSLGALMVTLSAAGGVFSVLIGTVRDWLGRQSAAQEISVTIDGDTLVLKKSTTRERRTLIDAYVRRHDTG
jgi:hypothetical protein